MGITFKWWGVGEAKECRIDSLGAWMKVKVIQPCPALCDPVEVHGILLARILEWVTFPFSRRSSQPRD